MNATTLGLIAGALTSMATVPQVIKSYRSKHVRDISIWQPLLLVVGTGLWLLYGVMIGDLPLILANAFSIICNGTLVCMKFAFDGNDKRRTDAYIDGTIMSGEET